MLRYQTDGVEKLTVKVHHADAHAQCPGAGLLKSIATMDRWMKVPSLECLRWIWTGKTRVSYFWLSEPMTPQVIREEMQYTDGLVIKGWI